MIGECANAVVVLASSTATSTGEANHDDNAAGRAHGHSSGGPMRQRSERDAGDVQQAGGNHKAHGEGDSVGPHRQFDAVGVAVKDRKCANQQRRNPERRLYGRRDHCA
jgi:hypothetical protein